MEKYCYLYVECFDDKQSRDDEIVTLEMQSPRHNWRCGPLIGTTNAAKYLIGQLKERISIDQSENAWKHL